MGFTCRVLIQQVSDFRIRDLDPIDAFFPIVPRVGDEVVIYGPGTNPAKVARVVVHARGDEPETGLRSDFISATISVVVE